MDIKKALGEEHAENFSLGDIVEWSTWDSVNEKWESHYGIIVDIKTKILSNRMVSISSVVPVDSASNSELEFYTLSLKLVSRANAK